MVRPSVTYASSQTQTQSIEPLETVAVNPSVPKREEVASYSTGIQTTESWPLAGDESQSEADHGDDGYSHARKRYGKRGTRLQREQREEDLRKQLRQEIEQEMQQQPDEVTKNGTTNGFKPNGPSSSRSLTTAEMATLARSAPFEAFIEKSSKVVERALEQDYDILADYSLEDHLALRNGETTEESRSLRQLTQFYDERWSKRRMISDIDFSPKFPEICLASYTKNPTAPHDPDGIVQLWNYHLPSRAEYVFHAQSDILTAKFSPFHPNLVFGACYSGQVLLWDTRAKAAAVQRTGLTGSGHTHPVYSMSIVGTQNAHNIFTSSTDGVCCSWSVDMLSQPQEFLELTTPALSRTEDLSPTCLSFAQSDPTHFLVGTEEGAIYPCNRYDRAGAKAGADSRLIYKGHAGPVVSIQHHPAQGPSDLSDLLLSSSLDWSFKVWRTRAPTDMDTKTAATAKADRFGALHMPTAAAVLPLLDVSRDDIVYDASWSPVRPGVFALVDGAGTVEIWSMTADLELPVLKAQPHEMDEDSRSGLQTRKQRSLNKVAWEPSDGRRLAVGGIDGRVTLFDVGTEYGGQEGARSEDWGHVRRLTDRLHAAVIADHEAKEARSKADPIA